MSKDLALGGEVGEEQRRRRRGDEKTRRGGVGTVDSVSGSSS